VRHFYSHRPWNHCVPPGSVGPIYNNSTVINNYVQGDGNNTVINVGPGTGAVAAATRTESRRSESGKWRPAIRSWCGRSRCPAMGPP
jgi:hypothetical protein